MKSSKVIKKRGNKRGRNTSSPNSETKQKSKRKQHQKILSHDNKYRVVYI